MLNPRSSLIAISVAALGVTACASKQADNNSAIGLAGPERTAASTVYGVPGAPEIGRYGGAAPSYPVSQTELDSFASSVGDRVFFDLDSHGLSAEARLTLDRQAQWLATRPNLRITVAGHADERGTREYNLALGSRRAAAARDYLVSRGVAATRVDTVSFGKERPIDGRASEEGWARNRNAQSVLVNGRPLA